MNSLLLRSILLIVFVISIIILIEYKFSVIFNGLIGNAASKKFTVDKNCVEEIDVVEQNLHFARTANDRQKAILDAKDPKPLQTYLIPQITCATAVRVGGVGDGGKWVCNPWRAPASGCVAYSLGVNNDISFENDIYHTTKKRCNTFSFDPAPHAESIFKPFNGTYRQWAVMGKTNVANNHYSIVDLATKFSHSKIEFLKMDIEVHEYSAFKSLFNSAAFKNGQLEICQTIVEMHGDAHLELYIELQRSLQSNGFLMFYKEANYFCPWCHEFSYIHRNCLQRYGVYAEPFNFNFV